MATTNRERYQAAEELADALRGAVETAQAKLQLGREVAWRDYARGKDIARALRADPSLLGDVARGAGPDTPIDDAIRDAVHLLLQRKLLVACDRKFKKPKPGRTKLVKWPRTLEAVAAPGFSEALFYAWARDRPTSPWYYLGSALLLFGVLAVTLFPLAPQWARLAVLYFLTGLLMLILGTMLARYAAFGAVWITTGHHLWLLPNLTSDTVPITQLLSPAVSFERGDPEQPAYAARAAVLLALLGAGFALQRTDPKLVKKSVSDAGSSLLEYLELFASRDALGNGTASGPVPPPTRKPAAGMAGMMGRAGRPSAPRPPAHAPAPAPAPAPAAADDDDDGGDDEEGEGPAGGAAANGDKQQQQQQQQQEQQQKEQQQQQSRKQRRKKKGSASDDEL